jgi:hypothetical protein
MNQSDKPKEPTLAEAVYNITTGPSGATMCCCRNRNAVNAGLERACGYCELRAALAADVGPHKCARCGGPVQIVCHDCGDTP